MNPQQWQTLTPEQQRQAWQQHLAQQQLDIQRQQVSLQKQQVEQGERTASTRRNLLWLFIGGPVLLVVFVVAGIVIGAAATRAGNNSAADNLQQVKNAAISVGYHPPAYTTVENQVHGICENLAKGMSHDAAAQAMVTGFGEGMTFAQASAIVNAAAAHVCR